MVENRTELPAEEKEVHPLNRKLSRYERRLLRIIGEGYKVDLDGPLPFRQEPLRQLYLLGKLQVIARDDHSITYQVT